MGDHIDTTLVTPVDDDPSDKTGPHTAYLTDFPYLGPPS